MENETIPESDYKSSSLGIWIISFISYFGFEKAIDFNLLSGIISSLSIILGLALALIEKKLWKTRIMRIPFLENYWTPVLEGRWEGTLERNGELHDFVLEIIQSFTSISCCTYSKHSKSSANATEILYDDQLKHYQLIYYWNGTTTNTVGENRDSDRFDGFTILDIIIQSGTVTNSTFPPIKLMRMLELSSKKCNKFLY